MDVPCEYSDMVCPEGKENHTLHMPMVNECPYKLAENVADDCTFIGIQSRAEGEAEIRRCSELAATAIPLPPRLTSTKRLYRRLHGQCLLFWANTVRLDFSVVQRTNEFFNQSGHPDRFGGINLTFEFLLINGDISK